MYNLPYFKEKDHAVVLQFMKEHPFALLIGASQNNPVATQVPFLFEERNSKILLKGHIMRSTDHHLALAENNNALCIFTGAHSYVSARLYKDQQTASTWNYMSVHARGKIKFLGEEALLNILQQTTDFFENDHTSPANYKNLPPEYVERLAKAIIAFEIEVDSIENVFKLSQNKDKETYQKIKHHLEGGDADAKKVAEEMAKRNDQLFK